MVLTPRSCRWLAAFVVTCHASAAIYAALQDSVTLNEFSHLPAGVSYWRCRTFAAYNVNPPLAKLLFSLPTLPLCNDVHATVLSNSTEIELGQELARATKDRYFLLFLIARSVVVIISCAGALIVFMWGRQLYGEVAGLMALSLWCLSPTMLAHGHLATVDVPAAVAAVGATYAFSRYLEVPRLRSAAFAGILLGIALCTKFSLLFLLPAWLGGHLAFAISRSRAIEASRRRYASAARYAHCAIRHWLIICITTLAIINISYLCEGTLRSSQSFVPQSKTFQSFTSSVRNMIGNIVVPFPSNYLRGLDRQTYYAEMQLPSYLNGEWSEKGWLYYYIEAFFIKEPLGFILLLFAAICSVYWVGRISPIEWILLIAPLILLLLLTKYSSTCQHYRYFIPALPFLFLFSSRIMTKGAIRPIASIILVTVGVSMNLWAAVSIHPHYLSFFNRFAGGPDHGHEWLANSNIDWGQDLFHLRDWLKSHPEVQDLKLAYYGYADPVLCGVNVELPNYGPTGDRVVDQQIDSELGPNPGWYAISVSLIQGMPCPIADGYGHHRMAVAHGYEYFRRFRPVGKAGYSIWIFHLQDFEVNKVRADLGLTKTQSED